MTNPPQGSDEPGRPGADPDRHPTQPVPSVEGPYRPYGAAAQPSGQSGQAQSGPPPYGPPPQPPSQPYGQYGNQPSGQAPPYGQTLSGPPQYGQAPLYGQPPQYGPQYGQPPPYGRPATPAKSRVGLIAAVTAGIVALIAVGVVLALTMSSTVLDRNAVQEDVAAQFEEREGVAIDLECAEEMEVTSGATYECTGTTADGEDVTLQIAVTDEETAAYTWTEP